MALTKGLCYNISETRQDRTKITITDQ